MKIFSRLARAIENWRPSITVKIKASRTNVASSETEALPLQLEVPQNDNFGPSVSDPYTPRKISSILKRTLQLGSQQTDGSGPGSIGRQPIAVTDADNCFKSTDYVNHVISSLKSCE